MNSDTARAVLPLRTVRTREHLQRRSVGEGVTSMEIIMPIWWNRGEVGHGLHIQTDSVTLSNDPPGTSPW